MSCLALVVLGLSIWGGSAAADRWRHRPASPDRIRWLQAHAPPGMALVPAGWFWMGSVKSGADVGSQGRHRVWTPAFYIDRYPVTNREYARYDHRHYYDAEHGDYPVTGITWSQAVAYLRSQRKVLPTEAEWEKAARGVDGREYPWGNSPGHWLDVASRHRSFHAVTAYHQPASPYGVHDMAGTIWQWARDNIQNDPTRQIIRGGAAGYGPGSDTTYSRGIEGSGVT